MTHANKNLLQYCKYFIAAGKRTLCEICTMYNPHTISKPFVPVSLHCHTHKVG